MSAPSTSTGANSAGPTPNTQKHELVSTSSAPANLQHRHSKPSELKLYDSNLAPLSYVDASVEHGIRSSLIQSTPSGNVSPTILLSPVLSRPIRSQSAHSPPFLRNSLVLAPASDNSDNELSCCIQGSASGLGDNPLMGSRSTTVCAINEPHLSSGSGTPLTTGSSILTSAALGRFGSPTQQHSLHRHGSSASDSGSMYNFFYKRQSFRSNRDSSNNNSLGSSSLNIPTAGVATSSHAVNDSMDSAGQLAPSTLHAASPAPSQHSTLSLHRIAVQTRGNSLQRSHSEAQPESGQLPERAMSIHLGSQLGRKNVPRRPSACVSYRGGDVHYQSSNSSSTHASSSILRARHTLGHSDPQLYTCSVSPCGRRSTAGTARALHLSPASAIRFRKTSIFTGSHGHNRAHRMSVLSAHGAPESSCSEPTSGIHSSNPSSTCALPKMPSVRRRRRPLAALSSGEGASTSSHHSHHHQRLLHHHHHGSNRSGSSLAAPYLLHHPTADNRRWSLASLPSSSGYGTPGSISALSSEFSSQEHLAEVLGDLRFNNRYDSNDSYASVEEAFLGGHRPRSRSLSSPVRINSDQFIDASMNAMSQMYKERFPKAKQQMENRLQQFLATNAPLSGFTSNISFDRPASPLNFSSEPATNNSNSLSENRLPPRQLSCSSNRPSSPCRPTSPIPRPISPLAMESATIGPDKVVFRSSHNNSQLACATPYGNSSNSIVGSFSAAYNYGNSLSESQSTTSRRSTMAQADVAATNPSLLRVLAEGATRFLHHQICEIAADCLQKSRDDQLTSAYFCKMSLRLEETLAEAQQKTSAESLKFLASISKQLLMIVSRTARLLESLEFDPDEFYRLLEETEGAIRYQLGASESRIPDLPQYIFNKLGLNKNLITDRSTPPELNEASDFQQDEGPSGTRKDNQLAEDQLKALSANAPKEEDFENIRLISNGAYGAVYLVRHKKTRQRFALKKMKKQTLLLRNQVEQVYAERDILTFTDNPFVVSFYGSFETKQHLCMLMEYVEGGDCASLLKSAGVLPIEISRLYVAETVLAIEYLHSCGIVHRDLKPDNLLITAIGHIKLTDFGLSKIGLMNRTTLVSEGYLNDTQQFKDNQLCGTPEYIAPEVILRQGYGKEVDWWALGIILYEFLIGIVPFLGSTPEELFTNIINEEVEYPTGDEALDPNAESLIQMLLEKNPVDRLGTIGGASDVAAHPFFSQLDFDSLLRQKAEFVPNLENDEDTSYFDARTDRYNHDAESCDDEPSVMFYSFSTASPRHSITAQEIPLAQLTALKALACSPIPGASQSQSFDIPETPQIERRSMPSDSGSHPVKADVAIKHHYDSADSTSGLPNIPNSSRDDPTSPSAILLRQRFSAQRQANYSTSSSGTNGTGCLNTCSSTDSSMDASYLLMTEGALPMSRRQTTNFSPLPRFAISSCDQPAVVPQTQPRRATLSADPETNKQSSSNAAKRTESLRVFIPQSGPEKSSSQTSIFYHSQPQPSPEHCQSRSSLSSAEPNSPLPPSASPIPGSAGSSNSNTGHSSATLTTGQPTTSGLIHPTSTTVGKPIVIKKGPKGYGFTIRSVRVYLSESSEYYTIEHIVAAVQKGSPADEAGLHENDLITHVHTKAVHNMTHPQLMHKLLSSTNEITLHIVPLNATTIKEGEARRNVGKLLKKKPRKPQRRVPLEKKAPRKTSNLFRRLSGKRTEIIPGSSSHKQSFMPRSNSSQDGVALSPAPMSQLLVNDSHLSVQPQTSKQQVEDASSHSPQLSAQRHSNSAHRRASGHQILPGVDEEVMEPKMRRKHTTGSIASTSSLAVDPNAASQKQVQQMPKIQPRKSIHEHNRPPPLSPIARQEGNTMNVPVVLPPQPPSTTQKEAPQRPSSLIERKPSSTSSGSQGTVEHKTSTASGSRLRPTELTARPAQHKISSTSHSEVPSQPRQKTSTHSLQTDRPSLPNDLPSKRSDSERQKIVGRQSIDTLSRQPETSNKESSNKSTKDVQNRPIDPRFYNDQPPAPPIRAQTLPPVSQNSEEQVTKQETTRLESQPKRPPVPTRRLSPSRLVQRLFRSATGGYSSSGSPPSNQK